MLTLSLITIAGLFGIYYVLSSLEVGISLLYIWRPTIKEPPQHSDKDLGIRLFTPMWEVTNVFLVFAFTGLAIFFSGALSTISRNVLSTMIVGLVALIIRSSLVVYIFYYRGIQKIRRLAGWLFTLTSLIVPISFGLSGIYFLTGQTFWRSSMGWVLAATLLVAVLSLALSFIYYCTDERDQLSKSLKIRMRILTVTFCLVGAIGLQLAISHSSMTRLLGWPFDVFIILIASIVLVETGLNIISKGKLLWFYLAGLALISPSLLALSNRPFLIYPNLPLDSVFSAGAYDKLFFSGLVISLPLIVIGMVLLFWLLIKPVEKSKK